MRPLPLASSVVLTYIAPRCMRADRDWDWSREKLELGGAPASYPSPLGWLWVIGSGRGGSGGTLSPATSGSPGGGLADDSAFVLLTFGYQWHQAAGLEGCRWPSRHLEKIRARPCINPMQEEAEAFTEEMDGATSPRASNLPRGSRGAALPVTFQYFKKCQTNSGGR